MGDPKARTELHNAAIDLCVTVGLIESVIGRFPEVVQENFTQKIEALTERLEKEREEFVAFGEAYDERLD